MCQLTVSFIVPAYNVEQYLTDAIESILKQNINKEIIIVNDGSKDNTLKIAQNYADQYPFIYVLSQENKGTSEACNAGIKFAKGKYIFLVDSDDYLIGDHFAIMVECADKYQVDLLKVQAERQFHFSESHSNKFPIQKAFSDVIGDNAKLSSGYMCLNAMTSHVWIPFTRWVLIRKNFLIENNIQFIPNIRAEDQLYTIQLLTCTENVKILEIDRLVYHYRLRPNSSVTTKGDIDFFLDHFRMIDLIKEWRNTHRFPEYVINSLNNIVFRLNESAYQYFLNFPPEIQHKYKHYLNSKL